MDFDQSKFTNEPFVIKNPKPWGYEIIFTKKDFPYSGKILHVDAGKRLSLQYHDQKKETMMLVKGQCLLIIDDQKGELAEIEMEPFKGYDILPGQKHRLKGITDCDVFEVSTPEIGTTYRLEDDYSRSDETDDLRTAERKNL